MSTSQNVSRQRHIVIAGGGFAGLGAAFAAKEQLGADGRITVVEPSGQFVFAPSLVWTAFGRQIHRSSFQLQPVLSSQGIEYLRSGVHEVRVQDNVVATDDREIGYDKLIIATGGYPNANAVPGLAGELRAAAWIVGEDSAMDTRNTLDRFYTDPGPVVIGVAQDATYVSAMYEIALMLDTELRQRNLRDRAPVSFVTSEPFLGELRYGQTAAREPLEKLFAERDIPYRTDARITQITRDQVKLESGDLSAKMSIIMPPFTGAVDIWKSAKVTDESGLIPVNDRYQHVNHPNIYAAGVSSYFARPIPPLPSGRAPHTGYLAIRMGQAAGENAAASLGRGKLAERTLPYLLDVRILDGGEVGLLVTARGNLVLENGAQVLPGRVAHYLKLSTERHLVGQLQQGKLDLV